MSRHFLGIQCYMCKKMIHPYQCIMLYCDNYECHWHIYYLKQLKQIYFILISHHDWLDLEQESSELPIVDCSCCCVTKFRPGSFKSQNVCYFFQGGLLLGDSIPRNRRNLHFLLVNHEPFTLINCSRHFSLAQQIFSSGYFIK